MSINTDKIIEPFQRPRTYRKSEEIIRDYESQIRKIKKQMELYRGEINKLLVKNEILIRKLEKYEEKYENIES